MSTWTTQRAGAMNTVSTDPTSPWYDAGTQTARASVPVDGDNIVGANAAHTLTLPAGATMTVGTAPATGGTAAIDTVAPLVINGVLHVKGDVKCSHATGISIGPDGMIDGIAGAGVSYYIYNGTGYTNYSPLIMSGTLGHEAIVQRTGAGTFAIGGAGQNSTGIVQASYAKFLNLGSASVRSINGFWSNSPTVRTVSFQNCLFDGCGSPVMSAMGAGDTFILDHVTFQNSLANGFDMDAQTARTTGTRRVTWAVFDKTPRINFKDFTVDNTYLGDAMYVGNSGVGNEWDLFQYNFVASTTLPGSAKPGYYSWDSCYGYIRSSSVVNPHPFGAATVNQDTYIQSCVFDGITPDYQGDWWICETSAKASTYRFDIYDCLYLGGPRGDGLGTPCTLYGNDKLKVRMRRTTFCMGVQSGFSFGENPGTPNFTGVANMIEEFASNLGWNASVRGGFLMWDGLGTTWDAVAGQVVLADYNGKYNHATTWGTAGYDAASIARGYLTGSSAGSNYAFQAGTTPGAHDVTGDPQFLDSSRCLATFDQDYLGKPIGTTWATATSYNVGDIVSSTVSGVWGGRAINYRCIAAHTSSAGSSTLGQPGAGFWQGGGGTTQWSNNWELAGDYWVRSGITAGTLYSDATLGLSNVSIIRLLLAWVRAGFSPTNTAYKGTGYTGEDIGAVAVTVLGTVPYLSNAMSGNFSIMGF